MNVRRFFAATAREALRLLKDELGADAIVLSNRARDGGVEILALPADAMNSLPRTSLSSMDKPAQAEPRKAAISQSTQNNNAAVVGAQAHQFANHGDSEFSTRFSQARQRMDQALRGGSLNGARAAMPLADDVEPGMFDTGMRGASAYAANANEERLPAPQRFDPPRVDAPSRLVREQRPVARPTLVTRQPIPPRNAEGRFVDDNVIESQGSNQWSEPAPSPALQQAQRVDALHETNQKLMTELSDIRNMIEKQLAGFAWGAATREAPARSRVMIELMEAGFSPLVAQRVAERVDGDASPEKARARAALLITNELTTLSSDADIIDSGGVFALVGPTGVGKTTTTAKLAARCVVRHGADKLALITTDGYRIGAHEQLRIYGRILGVPVFVVRDAADLRRTLAELGNRHMVLIDTVGVAQRDKMVAEQAAMLLGAGDVKRLLLLNSASSGDTLEDVVEAYRGRDLAGCILTKVDEAASIAPAVDVAMRHKLSVYYVANGQRVPEDLHLPSRRKLVEKAMTMASRKKRAWRLDSTQAGMLVAAHGGAA